MKIDSTLISDVFVVIPDIYKDGRGSVMEAFRRDKLLERGLALDIVQENHLVSKKNVLRGLHFQWDPPMGKLMRVDFGKAFLVAVDLRKKSKTFGKWVGVEATAENRKQLYSPGSFARGFCALSANTQVQYLCTGTYNSKAESGILWNDSKIGIEWPIINPILSEKDKCLKTLDEWAQLPESEYFN